MAEAQSYHYGKGVSSQNISIIIMVVFLASASVTRKSIGRNRFHYIQIYLAKKDNKQKSFRKNKKNRLVSSDRKGGTRDDQYPGTANGLSLQMVKTGNHPET